MAKSKSSALVSLNFLAICILATSLFCKATNEDRKAYIVYMGKLPDAEYSPPSHHRSILQSVVEGSTAANSLILSYKRSFNGFAASLTEREREKIASLKEVVSVFPSEIIKTHTTRSWDFMGFPETVSRNPTVENDIIIGVIDTGIWPESDSFNDQGFGPPPKKWKGVCNAGANFTCNNKIIRARFYKLNETEVITSRDDVGHGTHTASTAGGNAAKGSSFYGMAEGTARGAVPSARIATYKACRITGCATHLILAAFDDAIADGVDIINASFGHILPAPLYQEPVSIGSFHAMEKGVLTVNSAGNCGPDLRRITSVAPWVFTVAASSLDRRIIDKIVLADGKTIIGHSVNSFILNGTTFPLVYSRNASRFCEDTRAGSCKPGCLDSDLVEGKIVLCDTVNGTSEAYRAGAVGSIVLDEYEEDVSKVVPHASSALDPLGYLALKSYLNSAHHPGATILKTEVIKGSETPVVASFSLRGPNLIVPDILKPDTTAPGIEILAAFSLEAPPSGSYDDTRCVKYAIKSGTSMSSPHVAGAAAYVKSFHPDWSPSAIKSALMTTASVMKSNDYDGEFAYGSGHIDPVKAINPGLVYDAYEEDYVRLLCSSGYNESMIRLISGDNSTCSQGPEKESARDLNYPSMSAQVAENEAFSVQFHRKVKNVGFPNSTYRADLSPNDVLIIGVKPGVLSFTSLNEEKSFTVTLNGRGLSKEFKKMLSVSLVWSDGTHNVRTPIVIHCIK